jgi:hypothetical protein
MFLQKLALSLNKNKIPYAITGGYAVAFHGVVRSTIDIDLILLIDPDIFEKFAQIMKDLGLHSRIPVHPKELVEFREEYITQRNLIAWSFVNYKDPAQVVDVILTEDYKNLNVEIINLGHVKLKIVSVSDLIRMKKISNRPQDLIDIENLKKIK